MSSHRITADSNPCKRRKTNDQQGSQRGAPVASDGLHASFVNEKGDTCEDLSSNSSIRPSLGKKRRVSFNANTRVCELKGDSGVSSADTTPAKNLNNFSFHQSFREKLNRTSELAAANSTTGSPAGDQSKSNATKLFSTSSNVNLGIYNSPLSKSFSVGAGNKMTPQLPLGDSKFYSHLRGQNEKMVNSPLVANSTFDPTVFSSPNFGVNSTLPSRGLQSTGTPTSYRIRRASRCNLPLSGNAQKILEKLEQPVTHTEINRMRTMGPLKSLHDFGPVNKIVDVSSYGDEANESTVPTTPLPSFSFLSSKRVMPPPKVKITPPQLKNVEAAHHSLNPFPAKHSAESSVGKNRTSGEKASEFSFAPPTPKKFDFNQNSSSDQTSVNSAQGKLMSDRKLFVSKESKAVEAASETVSKPEEVTNNIFSKPASVIQNDSDKTQETKVTAKPKTLSDIFKPKTDIWNCDTCLVENKNESAKCVACETPNPNSKPKVPEPKTLLSSQSATTKTFPVASSNKLAEKFKLAAGTWSCDVCLVQNKESDTKCVACETSKPGTKPTDTSNGPVFKSNPSIFSTIKPNDESSSKPQFKFGVASSSVQPAFGANSIFSAPAASSTQSSGFSFGVSKSDAPSTTASSSFKFGVTNLQSTPATNLAANVGTPFMFGTNGSTTTNSVPQTQPTFKFGVNSGTDLAPKSDASDVPTKNVSFSFGMPSAKIGDFKFNPTNPNNNELPNNPKLTNGEAPKLTPFSATPMFSFANPSALGGGFKADPSIVSEPAMFIFNAPNKRK